MTPKEAKVYRSIGERILKTRSKNMSVTMNIPVDDFLVEIGKLHLQNASLQKQLHGANRRIAELTAENARLAKEIPPKTPLEFPSPQQAATDVAEAIHANETNKPA